MNKKPNAVSEKVLSYKDLTDMARISIPIFSITHTHRWSDGQVIKKVHNVN